MVPGQAVLEQLPTELQTSQLLMLTVVQSMSSAPQPQWQTSSLYALERQSQPGGGALQVVLSCGSMVAGQGRLAQP